MVEPLPLVPPIWMTLSLRWDCHAKLIVPPFVPNQNAVDPSDSGQSTDCFQILHLIYIVLNLDFPLHQPDEWGGGNFNRHPRLANDHECAPLLPCLAAILVTWAEAVSRLRKPSSVSGLTPKPFSSRILMTNLLRDTPRKDWIAFWCSFIQIP